MWFWNELSSLVEVSLYSVLKLITEWFIEVKWSCDFVCFHRQVFLVRRFLSMLSRQQFCGYDGLYTAEPCILLRSKTCVWNSFFLFLRRPLSEVYVQLSAFVSHLMFLLGSKMISLMFVGPCIIVITEVKNQQDATYHFIVLLIVSKCFGHCYAHHQEIATIMLIITLVVLLLGCYRLNMFRALLCPSSGVRDYNVDYHIGRFVL
jgi:hypothetical protein